MQKTHEMGEAGAVDDAPLRLRLFAALLHRWFLLTRGVTFGVRAVVLDAEDRVLLVEHTYVPGWHLPGGGVDIGETALAALVKELREEAGVTLTAEPRLHGIFYNARPSRRDHVAVYVARDFVWNGPPPPNREIRAADFFALSALPHGTTAATRRRLAETLDDAPVSATW